MGDMLIMSAKERERKVMMEAVGQGQFNLQEAANRLEVSYRQVKRIWKRYSSCGDKGLVHQSRGRVSSHRFDDGFKQKVLSRYEERYATFGPTFACEKLAEEGWILSDETLRLWLKANGIAYPKRKRRSHRQRRERREEFGALLQIDGSIHPWFQGKPESDCLLNIVDDATGISLALLAKGETTQVLLSTLMLWIQYYGIPKEVYVDLKSVYISPKLDGFSVFQEVCHRLGIQVNKAYSPQAKGRVERKHAVYQDRLVKELTLRGIQDIEAANQYLLKEFIPLINKKFGLSYEDKKNVHRAAHSYGDLNQIICWRFERVIKNDWTVQWKNQHYQILKGSAKQLRPKQTLELRLHLDGQVSLWRKDQQIAYEPIAAPIKLQKPVVNKETCHTYVRRLAAKKAKTHSPWRHFNPDWLKGKQEERVV
jgi:transposase